MKNLPNNPVWTAGMVMIKSIEWIDFKVLIKGENFRNTQNI